MKNLQAMKAKDNGMHTTYSNLLEEIANMKIKLKKFQMGGK